MSDVKTDLNQIVIFAKVVETRSFTAAGRALGLPKSTVSRKVAQLEERLGVLLLQRTTRKLSLTEVGAAFFERCARISTEIDEAEQAVMHLHRDPRGLLRVTASSELGTAFLPDMISDFLVAYPEVDIELELTDRGVDMIEEGFDLSIQISGPNGSEPNLISRELGPIQRFLVANPEYLARRGIPEHPDELENHDLLVLGNPRRNAAMELQHRDGEKLVIRGRPRLVVNSMGMLRDAVLAGVGIALLPAFKCAEELEQGRLRSFLPDWTHTELAIQALYPTSRHLSAKVRTFLDFVADRLNPPPWQFGELALKSTNALDSASARA
jgi:DNA-binding transcriptional LysR family regulator